MGPTSGGTGTTMPASKKGTTTRAKTGKDRLSEITPGVFVGGWKDAVAFQGERFCVLDDAPPDMPDGTHIAIYDGENETARVENLDRLAEAVRKVHAQGRPALIFCGHGVRRSALGGAWYLHRAEGLSLDAAYDRVRSVRPQVEHARDWVENAAELERA
jgi:dual specificity protein phosphatase-like protein